MAKDIVKELTDIQNEVVELRNYKKNVQKYARKGLDILFDDTQSSNVSVSEFESKICKYFGLESNADKTAFLEYILNEDIRSAIQNM